MGTSCQHGEQPLLGEYHIGQSVVSRRGRLHEIDCSLHILFGKCTVAKIGKSGVGRTHRPVKGCQIEWFVQGKRLGTRINVRYDILGMNGHQFVSVQTVR